MVWRYRKRKGVDRLSVTLFVYGATAPEPSTQLRSCFVLRCLVDLSVLDLTDLLIRRPIIPGGRGRQLFLGLLPMVLISAVGLSFNLPKLMGAIPDAVFRVLLSGMGYSFWGSTTDRTQRLHRPLDLAPPIGSPPV